MRRARSSSCAPVAWPWLTSTSACDAATPASPSRWPFQPHCVDQPGGRQLARAGVVAAEHRQRRMLRLQRLGLRRRHDRILEEAAGVAEHAPGRAACGGGSRMTASATCGAASARSMPIAASSSRDAGVVELQRAACAAGELDRGDDAAIRRALEHAVAVGERAVVARRARCSWPVPRSKASTAWMNSRTSTP